MTTATPTIATERSPRVDPRPRDQVGNRTVVYVATSGLVVYDVQQGKKSVQKAVLLETWRRWAKDKPATPGPDAGLIQHEVKIDSGLYFQINYLANKYLSDDEVRGQSTPHDQTLRTLLDIALLYVHACPDVSHYSFRTKLREVLRREVPSLET